MLMAPTVLETPRLRLRRPTQADAPAMFSRYASDPDVTKYLSWPTHRSPEVTRAFVTWDEDQWRRWPASSYLIFRHDDGTLVGGTGLSYEAIDRVATGYVLARDAWGQGYATESLGAMVSLASMLGLPRLHSVCHVDHIASSRVLEKGGFAFTGIAERAVAFPNLHPTLLFDVRTYEKVF